MPNNFLLDTNILVALVRGKLFGKAIQKHFNLQPVLSRCLISVVTVGEMEKLARDFAWNTA